MIWWYFSIFLFGDISFIIRCQPSCDRLSLVMCLLNIALIYLLFWWQSSKKPHRSLGNQSARIHFGRVDLNVIDPDHSSDPLLWPLIRLYVGVGIKEKGKKMESTLKTIVSKLNMTTIIGSEATYTKTKWFINLKNINDDMKKAVTFVDTICWCTSSQQESFHFTCPPLSVVSGPSCLSVSFHCPYSECLQGQ